jgi:Na+/melibiose symporter-like transporter
MDITPSSSLQVSGFGPVVSSLVNIPDLIEYDELITEREARGNLNGVKGLTDKIAWALGLFVVGGWC